MTYCRCRGSSTYWRAPPPSLVGRKYMVANGWKTFTVVGICSRGWCVLVKYCESGSETLWPLSKLIPTDGDMTKDTETFKTEKEEKMKTLYEIKNSDGDTIDYGHKLAVNSKGEWVMETKAGMIMTIDKSLAEEVMPYVVEVEYVTTQGKDYAFFAREGDWSVDDLAFLPSYNSMVKVTKVGSKNRRATKWLEGWKVSAKFIKGE